MKNLANPKAYFKLSFINFQNTKSKSMLLFSSPFSLLHDASNCSITCTNVVHKSAATNTSKQSKPCFKIIHTVCISVQKHATAMLLQILSNLSKNKSKFCTNNAKNLSKSSIKFHKNRGCKSCIRKGKISISICPRPTNFPSKNSF